MGWFDHIANGLAGGIGWAIDHSSDIAKVVSAVSKFTGQVVTDNHKRELIPKEDVELLMSGDDNASVNKLRAGMTALDLVMSNNPITDPTGKVTTSKHNEDLLSDEPITNFNCLWLQPSQPKTLNSVAHACYADLTNLMHMSGIPTVIKPKDGKLGGLFDFGLSIAKDAFANFGSKRDLGEMSNYDTTYFVAPPDSGVACKGVLCSYPLPVDNPQNGGVVYGVMRLQHKVLDGYEPSHHFHVIKGQPKQNTIHKVMNIDVTFSSSFYTDDTETATIMNLAVDSLHKSYKSWGIKCIGSSLTYKLTISAEADADTAAVRSAVQDAVGNGQSSAIGRRQTKEDSSWQSQLPRVRMGAVSYTNV